MSEISGTPDPPPPPTAAAAAATPAERSTKPGTKRLLLTLTVVLSFLAAFPLLLKSIEIHRSPLPFASIAALSARLRSDPPSFPSRFHAVFLPRATLDPERLALSLSHAIADRSPSPGRQFTVSATVDTSTSCRSTAAACLWRCGLVRPSAFRGTTDEAVDDALDAALKSGECSETDGGGRVYTVFVVETDDDDEVRVVVGKHRHAWIIGKVSEAEGVSAAGRVFAEVFMNGGRSQEAVGQGKEEFMPVGSDGRLVLSFSLLNANPNDWVYNWGYQKIDEILAQVVVDLAPVANISIESQVLYYTPKSSISFRDDKLGGNIFSPSDLPFFVNSNEWHLDTSVAAGGRSKVLQFAVCKPLYVACGGFTIMPFISSCSAPLFGDDVSLPIEYFRKYIKKAHINARYIPSASECPLLLRIPNGDTSKSNGFVSPLWGGVVVWNPPNCSRDSQRTNLILRAVPGQDLHKIFQVFIGQLRILFGFKSDYSDPAEVGITKFLASESGFTKWELDELYRHYACYNLISSATTLESLSSLVQSLPRMIVMDEIGKQMLVTWHKPRLAITHIRDMSSSSSSLQLFTEVDTLCPPQVKLSLDAATLAQQNASLGISDASAVDSRNARALAEDAFFHPSLMSISYSSIEHYFAIYMPFFVPVLLHVLLAAIKELKRYKKERAKNLAYIANQAKAS